MKKNLFKGIPISPGVAIGKCLLLEKRRLPVFRLDLEDSEVEAEIRRLQEAIEKSKGQLSVLKEQLSARLGQEHSYIMDAQTMMLSDSLLIGSATDTIRNEKVNAEWALNETSTRLSTIFNNIQDEYFRERGTDVQDVINRIQANLAQINVHDIANEDEDVIILAYQLSPSDIVELQHTPVVGFATELGGRTSHTAIIARSLETPAVAGIQGIGAICKSGQTIIVDGYEGALIADPTATQKKEYQNKKRYYEEHATLLMSIKDRGIL